MTGVPPADAAVGSTADRSAAAHLKAPPRRWLLLVHQLPPRASSVRVRTWRRLQQLGAIPLKQAVYLLPDTPEARVQFESLKTAVQATGGDASVFAANTVDAASDDALVAAFRRAGQEHYGRLAEEIARLLRPRRSRRSAGGRAPSIRRRLAAFRDRLDAITSTDFFACAGRDRVDWLLTELEGRVSQAEGSSASSVAEVPPEAGYRHRLWVTRPRPGVDRMASAWLIRRFIDPDARFGFVLDRTLVPPDAVPFDMSGIEFSHRGDGCTFETLCAMFALSEPALARIAAVVHDLDLKDGRFGVPEASTISALIHGLQMAHSSDQPLLEAGMTLFEALYCSLRSGRPAALPSRGRGRSHTHPGNRRR